MSLVTAIEGPGARASGREGCEVLHDALRGGRPCINDATRWTTLRYPSGVSETKRVCDRHGREIDAAMAALFPSQPPRTGPVAQDAPAATPSTPEAPCTRPVQSPAPAAGPSLLAAAHGGPPEPLPEPEPPTMPSASTSTPSPASETIAPVSEAGGGVSSRRCPWPDCGAAGKPFCSRDRERIRKLGLKPADVAAGAPALAEVVAMWEGRTATPVVAVEPDPRDAEIERLKGELSAVREALVLGVDRIPPDMFMPGSVAHAVAGEMHDYARAIEARDQALAAAKTAEERAEKAKASAQELVNERNRYGVWMQTLADALGFDRGWTYDQLAGKVRAMSAAAESLAADRRDVLAALPEIGAGRLVGEVVADLRGRAAKAEERAQHAEDALHFARMAAKDVDSPTLDPEQAIRVLGGSLAAALVREREWLPRVGKLRDSLAHALGYTDGAGETSDEDLLDALAKRLSDDDYAAAQDIARRDAAEDALSSIARLTSAPEWSSGFGFADLVAHVDEYIAGLRARSETRAAGGALVRHFAPPSRAEQDRERILFAVLCDVIDADNPSVITRAAVRGLRAMVGGAS